MKRKSIYRILAVLFTAVIFFTACTKDDQDVKLAPKLSTAQLLSVTSDGATVVGFVIAQGDGFVERGVCYNTATTPTIENSIAIYTGANTGATFNVPMSGLAYATTYYVRAYATDANGVTIYGEEFTFTTLPVVPTLQTDAITEITGNSASTGGMVLVDGGALVTVQGVCFGTNPAPTIADSKTADGKAAGPYVSALAGLKGNTKYYVRAYATNSAGTGYGPEQSFTTLIDKPVVTTAAVSLITKISATSGGEVTYDGGGTITARGLAWGLTADPTIAGTIIAGGTGTGAFVSNLTDLTKNTTYHVRAYATNSAGTSYGADISFLTLADILIWHVPGDYLVASYPGGTYKNWDPANSPILINSPDVPNILEGFVYMANASNKWKCTSLADWTGTNYGPGATAGTFSTDNNAGDIIAAGPAYYQIKADPAALTYTIVATTWGVIGDATDGGWDNSTPLTFSPATQTWSGPAHLKAGAAFKFRANNAWAINYGSVAHDGKLDTKDNNNIPVTFESDYIITLDLSHAQAYTYSTLSWGLIGDATPGGWSTDTPLSYDATNKVWTATVTLVSSGGAKSFKFRANQAWDLNLGGKGTGDGTADNYAADGFTAALAAGGKNLGVPANVDGTYKVTLNPVTLVATVVLQ
ncbi:MAG: hypothetical protein Q7U54_09805 [Bacteroidales bacterium]|nr:hypothetical protein [Bacteroidales bacterium]